MFTAIGDYYAYFGVVKGDMHKAIEAEGSLAVANIKYLLGDVVDGPRRVEIMRQLGVLKEMLARQSGGARDASDVALYSDGSPVFRLIFDGATDLEERNCLGYYCVQDLYESFDSVGELAEYLVMEISGYRAEVNRPPAQEMPNPINFRARLMDSES